MRGNKTTAIDGVTKINKILKRHGIKDVSYGIIIQVKNRKDHRITVKITEQSGALLLSVTGKRYKQEFRIYNDVSKEYLKNILEKDLGEQFRFLNT